MPKNKDQTPSGPANFEAAMAEVESIIERIENGQIGLEESVAEYERGAKLLKECRDRLNQAEQRVRDLTDHMREGPSAGQSASVAPPGEEGDSATLDQEASEQDDDD